MTVKKDRIGGRNNKIISFHEKMSVHSRMKKYVISTIDIQIFLKPFETSVTQHSALKSAKKCKKSSNLPKSCNLTVCLKG